MGEGGITTPDDTFERAMDWTLRAEGGYVDDPRDPGGRTRFGISQAAYPYLDLDALTLADAKAIYRRDYWQACSCDRLPWLLSLSVFDCAVNQGVPTAIRLLQKALGVTTDGRIGTETLAAAQARNAVGVTLVMIERRLRCYRDTNGAEVYLLGWSLRPLRLRAECLREGCAQPFGASSEPASSPCSPSSRASSSLGCCCTPNPRR